MFSVIIPYYKKRKYIERCLDSVVNQSYKSYEVILVDDGSQDDISELINSKYGLSIQVISQQNAGVSAARNAGIEEAKFPYVAFLDSDDSWHSDYLLSMATILANEQDVKIIGAHYTRNKEKVEANPLKLNYYKFENYFKDAIRNTMFTSSSSVIKTSFFKENSGFNSNLKNGEDIDVWLRTVASGGNAFYITNTLVYYSDEDINQATNSKADIATTLVGTINTLYAPLLEEGKNKDFSLFVSKYVYFNLYPYYFDKKYHDIAKVNLKKNRHSIFLLQLAYWLPLWLGEKLIATKKGNLYFRLYLKFVLRYMV